MNIIKYALFIAALSLPVTNTHALEWVDYDGTIPDNAVSVNEGTEDRPICRRNARIGLIKNDKCHSVKAGGSFDKKEIDDGYQILVDTYNVYDAVQAGTDMYTQTDLDDATEDMYTQAEYDAATDGMYTQAEYDAAAEDMYTQTEYDAATEDMFTQTDVDAAVTEATEGLYTQDEYDEAVAGSEEGSCNSISPEAMQEALNSLNTERTCWDEDDCISISIKRKYQEAIDEGIDITAADIFKHNNFWLQAAESYPLTSNYTNNIQWMNALAGKDVHPVLSIAIATYAQMGSTNNSNWH